MNEEIIKYISVEISNLDLIIERLKQFKNNTREQDIAIQKLEEAVFWLTYGIED